jgi:tetratricopeptide (TPR) repeat protein
MNSSPNFLELIQQIESLIRSFDLKAATTLIESIPSDSIQDKHIPKMASLAKRLNLPELGMKILWPKIYEQTSPGPDVVLEYASCLRKAGLCRQAFLWLRKLPKNDVTLRELALAHMPLWEYAEAYEILTDILSRSTPETSPDYGVIKLNLSSCCIFLEKPEEALGHLDEIIANKGFGNKLIHQNAMEMRARCLSLQGRPTEALEYLKGVLPGQEGVLNLPQLFVKKWQFQAKLATDPSWNYHEEMFAVQTMARKLGHWETLRDLDYQVADLTGNQELLTKVYFGTPFDSYKSRLVKRMGSLTLPNFYIWKSVKHGPETRVLDSFLEVGMKLGLGQTEHRLFLLLLSDQYRPFSVEKLFDELHREDLYDPFSSKNRMHTLIKSLRKQLVDFEIPMNISSTIMGYRVRPDEKSAFQIYPKMSFVSGNDFYLTLIQYAFGAKYFKRGEFETYFNFSSAQGHRRLKELVDNGVLEMAGKSSSTRYRLK